MANALTRPSWWWDILATPKLEFASLTTTGPRMSLITAHCTRVVDLTLRTDDQIGRSPGVPQVLKSVLRLTCSHAPASARSASSELRNQSDASLPSSSM